MTKPNFELGPDGELPDHIADQLPSPTPLHRSPRKLFRFPRSTLFTALFSFVVMCGFFTLVMRTEWSRPITTESRISYDTRATQEALRAAHSYFDGIPSCASRSPNTDSTLVFRAGSAGGLDLLRVDENGGNLCRMTHDLRLKYDPSFSPDGETIVFSRQTGGGNLSLFTLSRDSSIFVYLSSVGSLLLSPDWSPDGRIFALQTERGLALAPATTGEILRDDLTYLTDNPLDSAPDWSPDGQRLVFVRGSNEAQGADELYVMGADGSGVHRLTENDSNERAPHWSPDGREIIYTADGYIYAMTADGSNVRRLAAANYEAYDPIWSPDGEYIAFASPGADPYTDFALYIMDRNGHNVRPLTPPLGVADIDWR